MVVAWIASSKTPRNDKYLCHREPVQFTGAAIHATCDLTTDRSLDRLPHILLGHAAVQYARNCLVHGLLRRKLLAMTKSVGTRVPVRPGVPPAFKCGRLGSRPHHHLSSRAGGVYRRDDPCRVG